MTKKESIISVTFIGLLLLCMFYFSYTNAVIRKSRLEIQAAGGRLEILKKQLEETKLDNNKLLVERDSLLLNLSKAKKHTNDIKIVYYEKKRNVINLPLDSSIIFCSRWLSQADSIRR
jgi:Tfp pilus assembly protein PilE